MTKVSSGCATALATVAIVAGALAVAAPNAASAAYGIVASSSATAGGIYQGGGETCTYPSGGCSGGARGGGTATAGLTTSGGANATFVAATESVSGAGAEATSTTTIDLSTASISLYGADSNVLHSCSSAFACGGTTNGGSFEDVLHFSVAGASPTTLTTIDLTFTVDGSMTNQGTAMDDDASGEINGGVTFGGSDARYDIYSDSASGYQTKANYLDTYPSDYPGVWASTPGFTSNVYTETYTLTGATEDIPVSVSADLYCNEGYSCDFADGIKLGLSLPSGVSFTSDSGVFLTVPEPATWAMMLVGVGGLGAVLRRHRARVAFA